MSGHEFFNGSFVKITNRDNGHQVGPESKYLRVERSPGAAEATLNFVGNQGAAVRRFDPNTVTEFSLLGEYDESRLPAFREQAWPMMRTWKRYFGWGSLQICITLALLLEVPEYYLLLRVTLYNLAFYGPLRAYQRVASQRTMAAIGLAPGAN